MAINATQEKRWRELKEALHAGKGTPDRIAAWKKEYEQLDSIRRGVPAPAAPAPAASTAVQQIAQQTLKPQPLPVSNPGPISPPATQPKSVGQVAPPAIQQIAKATAQGSRDLSDSEERRFAALQAKRKKDLKSMSPSELAEYKSLQDKRHGGTERQGFSGTPGTGGPSYGGDTGGGAASGEGGSAPGGTGQGPLFDRKERIDNLSNATEDDQAVEEEQAGRALRYANPDQQTGALGDSRQVIYNPDGTIKEVKDSLSGAQQGIVNADNAISSRGRELAVSQLGAGGYDRPFAPQTIDRKIGGDLFGADRSRIEDAVFRQLTRNNDRDKQRERAQLESSLADRGVALDPRDPIYSRAMQELNERYDTVSADARDRATMLGGQEQVNAFGMQEQTIANQYQQGWGTRQNQLGETSALSNLGPGLRTSNFQGIQGTGYQLADPINTQLGLNADRRANRQLDYAFESLKRRPSSGGGGSDSAFDTGLPPGLG